MTLATLHREHYGRILATLIRQFRDFALAEDALQDAFASAHTQWPRDGTPPNPVGWLLTTARHKAIDHLRRQTFLSDHRDAMVSFATDALAEPEPADTLRLIFTCCHPALAPDAQIALTLRTVCGLTTEEIARAFLLQTPALAQRLVRAQTKIKLAGIPYEIPANDELAERLASALAVIYLVFNEGYSATAGEHLVRHELCAEAIRLARQLVSLLPNEPEIRALLALMLFTHARRDTRTDSSGAVVLLEHQERTRWDRAAIDEGRSLVESALHAGPPGPYALQAAIAALHAHAPTAAETDWPQIAALYDLLFRQQPTPIVALNRAVAIAMAKGPEHGLALLDEIDLPNYHLLPAARADLLRRLDRRAEAADAYRAALQLVKHPAERRYLETRLKETTQ